MATRREDSMTARCEQYADCAFRGSCEHSVPHQPFHNCLSEGCYRVDEEVLCRVEMEA